MSWTATAYIPLSNCYIERIFSMMAFVKTKWRNATSLQILNALLQIKTWFMIRGKCCKEMQVTKGIMALHNSAMYDFLLGGQKRKADEEQEEDKQEKEEDEDEEFDYFVLNLPVEI